jgi:S1-C subfamily serine protease
MDSLGATVAARIARAIVRVSRLGGQGVLVPGGFVVTAAHCIGWTAEGRMALGDFRDYYSEEIVAADGRTLTVQPLAVEPVSDLAVLGAVDGQASDKYADAEDAFEDFCRTTKPVRLALDEFALMVPFVAYVFTHNKGIIPVQAQQCAPGAASLVIHADERIDGGTSGGPVVTRDGRLLGIISSSGSVQGDARCPEPTTASPSRGTTASGSIRCRGGRAPAPAEQERVPGAIANVIRVHMSPGARRNPLDSR